MSKFTSIYSRNAATELKEVATWYNNKQKGLGRRFRNDVLSVIHK